MDECGYEKDLLWLQEMGEKVYCGVDLTDEEKMQLISKIQDNMEEIQILDKRLRKLENHEEG